VGNLGVDYWSEWFEILPEFEILSKSEILMVSQIDRPRAGFCNYTGVIARSKYSPKIMKGSICETTMVGK